MAAHLLLVSLSAEIDWVDPTTPLFARNMTLPHSSTAELDSGKGW
jgi:hypothetical protein